MNTTVSPSWWRRAAPGLSLMLAAPLCAEVLPGATRLSSLFVFPVEILVWGGGALMIREIARRRQLGWSALLLMGLALAVAEECLIQQTSLAPIVIKLKGVEYARAFGVNYVYLLWALVYEAVLVVLVPVALVELVFPRRARGAWMNLGGSVAVAVLFVVGSFAAWFSWTQIARVKVFHLPPYAPPALAVALAIFAIVILVAFALYGGRRARQPQPNDSPSVMAPPALVWNLPARTVFALLGALGSVLWYGLVLLAFGVAPHFPPAIAVGGGLAVCVLLLTTLLRWSAGDAWSPRDTYALVFGTMLGSMLVSFVGFFGAKPADLWFKIIVDAIAAALLIQLGHRVRSER